MKSTGHGTDGKVMAALNRWGPNKFDVPIPQFQTLLGQQLLAPFFCFQVFCVGLWALDEYWYEAVHMLYLCCKESVNDKCFNKLHSLVLSCIAIAPHQL